MDDYLQKILLPDVSWQKDIDITDVYFLPFLDWPLGLQNDLKFWRFLVTFHVVVHRVGYAVV